MSDQQPCSQTPEPHDYPSTNLLIYPLILTLTFLSVLVVKTIPLPAQVNAAAVEQTPVPRSTPTPTPEPSEEPEPTGDPIQEREAIRKYINVIFGAQGKTAYAISLAEGKAKKLYKGEVVYNVNAIHKSDAELSIGIFQINLKSKETLVHWARVPGQTEAEKIEWLKNPYNNVLMAYWIYSNHNNFNAWSVYTSNTYLAYVGR
jgi:hypothetical protein